MLYKVKCQLGTGAAFDPFITESNGKLVKPRQSFLVNVKSHLDSQFITVFPIHNVKVNWTDPQGFMHSINLMKGKGYAVDRKFIRHF